MKHIHIHFNFLLEELKTIYLALGSSNIERGIVICTSDSHDMMGDDLIYNYRRSQGKNSKIAAEWLAFEMI